MRRARRWIVAVAVPLLIAGCASSSDVGGETYTAEDFLWTCTYFGMIVLGVVAANIFVEAHE